MGTPSFLGMTPARRRIFAAGYAFQAEQEAADRGRREREAEAERQRVRVLVEHRAAALAAFLSAMPRAAEMASKVSRPRAIIKAVADQHGLDPADITGPGRSRRFVLARQEAMWVIKKMTPLSLPEIGRCFGGRDHTTVLHGIRQHQKRLDADASRAPGGEE